MNRRTFIAGISVGILAAPLAAEAQPVGKVWRIGYLGSGSSSAPAHPINVLREALRELGYIEDRNVVIDYRLAQKPDEWRALANELVRLNVDLLVAESTPHVRAARAATDRIPIVMMTADDPVGEGFVSSLAHPGGNVTGFTFLAVELSGKRLELLKEAIPKIKVLAVLWNPASPVSARSLEETEAAARALGIHAESFGTRSPSDVHTALPRIAKSRPGALIVLPDAMLHTQRDRILAVATAAGVPTVYHFSDFATAGALLTYGPNLPDLYRRSATYVDRILKGAKPADLPVEQPTKFELIINLKTAKTLGLTIPQSLLIRADQIIE